MTPAQVFVVAGGHQRQQQHSTTSLPQGAKSDPAADMAQLARLTFG